MQYVLVLATIVAAVLAAPLDDASQAQTLRIENENIGDGNYKYAFETSNGIQWQEQGELKEFGPEDSAIVVRGTVSWIAEDGQTYSYSYVADENGFRPEGAHLPQ